VGLQKAAIEFVKKAKERPEWVEDEVIKYMILQEDRVKRGGGDKNLIQCQLSTSPSKRFAL
jgi:hypothetical protein